MPTIRILPPEIVNRIAAGEVVERPASLVKELLENSIDAHATELQIDLEDGGKKSVTVRDNGSGMLSEDLPLAFESHATSKLQAADLDDNLLGITSLGFRGEALSSIASVAEVEVVSRVPGAEHGYRYRPMWGTRKPEPAAAPPGTVVDVRNLFYNVPARRKFLRTVSTELSHVLEQVTRLALPFPGVGFHVRHNGRKLLSLLPCEALQERLVQILGKEKAADLLEVREAAPGDGLPRGEGALLHGFVGSPRLRRSDARSQYFFANGRWVRDRLLAHALRSAFQGYLIPGQQPVAYLFLELPPDAVDVNVHPTKTEVRFRAPGEIYPMLLNAVRGVLGAGGELVSEDSVSDAREPSLSQAPAQEGARPGNEVETERRRIHQAALDFLSSPERDPRRFATPPGRASRGGGAGEDPGGPPVATTLRAFQVLDSYIVVEEEDGIAVIDQHALHEKILFERLHRNLREGDVVRQRLLVPEIVTLSPSQMPLVERAGKLLGPCGFEIEIFGDREIAVHAVPRLLEERHGPEGHRETLLEVFRWLQEEAGDASPRNDEEHTVPEPVSLEHRKLASLLACKRAVKAGHRLSPEEIQSLLEHAELARDPRHCPHGRPTAIYLSRRELERRFDRK